MDETTAVPPDAEIVLDHLPDGHKAELRLWLRLLTCTTLIEAGIRRRLRREFGVTLPRFDLMAQLDKAKDDGMTLGEASRRMMVSAGNVTGLVERLVASGHVERTPAPNDRRAQIVRLTKKGRAEFARMAAAHEGWIADIFGDLSADDRERIMSRLAQVKASARRALEEDDV